MRFLVVLCITYGIHHYVSYIHPHDPTPRTHRWAVLSPLLATFALGCAIDQGGLTAQPETEDPAIDPSLGSEDRAPAGGGGSPSARSPASPSTDAGASAPAAAGLDAGTPRDTAPPDVAPAIDTGRTILAPDASAPKPTPDAALSKADAGSSPDAAAAGSLGPVGHWTFDVNGARLAADGSGNRLDAVWVGSSPPVHGAGRKPGSLAITLPGKGAHLRVEAAPALDDIRREVTLAAWVSPSERVDGWAMIASRRIGMTNGESYSLALVYGRPRFEGLDIGNPGHGRVVRVGDWVHVAGTYDGQDARLFVDGVEVARVFRPGREIRPDGNALIIGGNQNQDDDLVTQSFVGLIDDLRIYPRALSASEIAALAR